MGIEQSEDRALREVRRYEEMMDERDGERNTKMIQ